MKQIKGIILFLSIFNINSYAETSNSHFTGIITNYQSLSTSELEREVEKRSQNGTLPFDMGLELIKRWTNR